MQYKELMIAIRPSVLQFVVYNCTRTLYILYIIYLYLVHFLPHLKLNLDHVIVCGAGANFLF